MIEIQNQWEIYYDTVVAAMENPKVIGWSWANDTRGYKGNVHRDTVLVHVECNKTWGNKEKRVLYILDYHIKITLKGRNHVLPRMPVRKLPR